MNLKHSFPSLLVALCVAWAGPASAHPGGPGIKDLQALPSFAPLVEEVKAAVVNVKVVSKMGEGGEGEEDMEQGPGQNFGPMPFGPMPFSPSPFGRNPFGFHPMPHEQLREGQGSGFVIDSRGTVLTNNHVVEGATSIEITFDDGRKFQGEVLGRDDKTDVALVRIKGHVSNLPYVKLGDSDAIRVGDWVMAIGNPFGLASSVSVGIISARARELHATYYDDFLQTDAAINPGNSGGPLFNLKGEVIGINTAIVSGGTGIGFAVPSNLAKGLIPQLERSGHVVRGFMGVGIQPLTADVASYFHIPTTQGAMVFSVEPASPAQKAGLKVDDAIVAVDGKKIDSDSTLRRVVALKAPGSVITLDIYRNGSPMQVKVKLTKQPENLMGRAGRHHHEEENPDEEQAQPSSPSGQRIGLRLRDLDDVDPELLHRSGLPTHGALITDVQPGSAADEADLSPETVVVEANHQPVHSAEELSHIIKAAKPGSLIMLRIAVPNGMGSEVRVLHKPG